MNSISRLLVVLSILLVATPCLAVESIVKNGKTGVFLTEEEFDKVLADKEELNLLKGTKIPLLNEKILKLELLIVQKDQEIKILDDVIKKRNELYEASLKLKQAQIDVLDKRIEKMDKWYRSSTFTILSGVFLGGALSVGLAFGLNGSEASK